MHGATFAKASNYFITSKMYQKWSGDVILGYSGRHCSVYEWQSKIEHELIKTTLISSVLHFRRHSIQYNLNFGIEPLFGELTQKSLHVATGLNFWAPVSLGGKFADICLMRIIAYSGLNTQKSRQMSYAINWIRPHWRPKSPENTPRNFWKALKTKTY